MINKKLLVSLMMLLVFCAPVFCAGGKNFVSVLSGTSSLKSSSNKINNSSFVGQSVVFKEVMNKDLISNSGFASSISMVQNENISFTMLTDITKIFTTQVVPLKLKIATTSGNIQKIKYQILRDEKTQSWEEFEIKDFTKSQTVTVEENISFSTTTNYIKFYAINDVGGEAGSFSPVYTITLSTDVTPGEVKITSPDTLTKLTVIDPQIQTTTFDIKQTTGTVALYKGAFASGTPIYEVNISSSVPDPYGVFDSSTSRINYKNSQVTVPDNKLVDGQTYTLKISLWNTLLDEEIPVEYSPLTFRALSGGVADVLTYPSPFNPNREKIKIRYILANDSRVTIKLYDKAGKIVCKLQENVSQSSGTNEVEWNGRNYAGETLATGAYIVEIIAKAQDGEHRRYTALAIVGK